MSLINIIYAHNNLNDVYRFKNIVHEILKENKRYISDDIRIKHELSVLSLDGNDFVGKLELYNCVLVQFYYPNKDSKSFTEINYISNGYKIRFHADSNLRDANLSKADLSVITKINQAYDEFESTKLDKDMPKGPQTTGQLYLPPKETDENPKKMIDWLEELENRIPENDPLYEQFHEYKDKALEYRKEKIEDIFVERKKLKQTVGNFSWLKNLPDPNNLDGDFPNIKGLKDLFDDITKYTFSWAKTGIKDIDDNMIKIGTYASTCKSIIEGKSSLHEIALRCTCPKCKEDVVVNPIYEEKKSIEKDNKSQDFTKENLILSEIQRCESKIYDEIDHCKRLIHQLVISTTGSKDKEEEIIDSVDC